MFIEANNLPKKISASTGLQHEVIALKPSASNAAISPPISQADAFERAFIEPPLAEIHCNLVTTFCEESTLAMELEDEMPKDESSVLI
jgi:hypothetical protein